MTVSTISPAGLAAAHKDGQQLDLIDVRTPIEFREVHVEFARNVPLDGLDPKAVMKARNGSSGEPLYVICRSGGRGQQACEKFRGRLYECGQCGRRHAGLRRRRACRGARQEGDVAGASGADRGRVVGADWGHAGLFCSPGVHRPVGFRRGGTGFCRHHRHLRHGPVAGPNAVEPVGAQQPARAAPAGNLGKAPGRFNMKLVIVGGVAGGASAATRARRLSEAAASF